MVVDDESEIVSFRSARRRCHGNQFCCRWMQVASGAAGSANVWLFPAANYSQRFVQAA